MAEDPLKVLIFNSYSPDFYFTQGEVAGIKDALNEKNKNIIFTTEYMGRPRVLDEHTITFDEIYENLFKAKYVDTRMEFDVIFVTDDPALDFMFKNHDRYFPDVPVVFCGINQYKPETLEGKKGIFMGVLEHVDYEGTFEIALKLHPKTKRFYILCDSRKISQQQKKKVQEIAQRFPVEFIYLDTFTFEELAEKLKSLTDTDIVFRLSFYTDTAGKRLTLKETMTFLEANINVPVYSFWKGVLGKGGIIGGKLLSSYHHGREAVGKFYSADPEQKFEVAGGNNPYMFDYNQLQRFNININSLPEDSHIINLPFSFYETYKSLVLKVAVFVIILILILVLLLINIKKRKRVEQYLVKTRSELKEANIELENRVEERTLELQKAKEKAETANNAKSEFISNMSHELRTPLNAVLGYSQILQAGEQNPKRRSYLTSIQTSGSVLLSMINDILDMSKIESGTLELTYALMELEPFLRDLNLLFSGPAREKGLEFSIQCGDRVPKCLIMDKLRLQQVCINLVGNAIKYTDHGYVRLELDVAPSEEESANHHNFILKVKDSGIGIETDRHALIFDPFIRIKSGRRYQEGSTGLGLSISKRLVNMMGGTITVESEPKKGSTFTVFLPEIEMADHLAEKEGKVSSSPDTTNIEFMHARLLVVDDIDYNREILITFLEPFGFEFIEAEDGRKALEIVEEHMPDLILLDMKMPEIDGYEVIRQLKSSDRYSRIPVVAVTASAMKEDEFKITQTSDGYLRKPINKKDLILELMRFLPHNTIETPTIFTDTPNSDNPQDTSLITSQEVKERITNLPQEIVSALKNESAIAHSTGVLSIVEQIRAIDPELASTIRETADQFDFEKIHKWTEYR